MSNEKAKDVVIAFLGTGQMGTPMAARLVAAGYLVRVWNRSPDRVKELVERGAHEAASPAVAVDGADVVITMLPDGQSIETVLGGPEGAFTTVAKGAVWLQMGTIGIEWTERWHQSATEAGVLFVDAPVSGSVSPANEGRLIVLASGPDEARAIADPVFAVLGSHTFWLGGAGAGSRAKLVLNNWLVDLVEMVVETLRFSKSLGLDPRAIVEMLADAPIGSPYAVAKAKGMLDDDFTPNFALKHAVKDSLLALDAARAADEELPITEGLIGAWQRALDYGAGDLDLSVVYRYRGD